MSNIMKIAPVGTSSRTPVKHWLLNHTLGRVVGALTTNKTPCRKFAHVVDLCAGDGDGGEYSSPGIILKHITSEFPGSDSLLGRHAHLYEREQTTFDRLRTRYGNHPSMRLENKDSKGWTVRDINPKPKDCIFIYVDPNSVATLPVTDEMIRSFTQETLFLMALGYNASGCKRVSFEERSDVWFKTAMRITDSIQSRHDMLLIWLVRDDAQWAYLVAVPSVWSAETLTAAIKKGNSIWPKGCDGLSLKTHGKAAITNKFRELIFTKTENNQ